MHLTQYTVYGDQGRAYVGSGVVELADREEVRLGVRRRQGVHQYEWRIDMSRLSAGKLQIRPGMVLGLGVAASDVDADGSASWLGWGSVVANPFAPLDDLGDVLLVANEAQVGRVEGALVWDDTGEAVRYGEVQLEQLGMQIVARTDRSGRYGVEVPAGRYYVTPWIGGEQQEVEVKPVSMAEASVRVRVPEGEVVPAGEGRRKKMGSGVHQGLWTTWERQDGLPAYVCALAQDQRGKMWFAHLGRGVSYCDGEDCVEFTPEDGLPAHEVLALHADQQGNMWLGTDGGGVVRYDGKEFEIFTTREGLVHDVVRAIGEDRQGRLWFATQGGVSRYRPGHNLPLVFLKGVVADRPYGPAEAVELPTSQDYLAFEFRMVSFSPPDGLVYRYRLQGYDREWRTTRSLKAEYRDLPIGEYVFEVLAVDQDLNYSALPAKVRVKVHLPYGRLAWIAALVVAVGVGCWQTYRVIGRGRRLRQTNQALSAANKELFRVSQAKSSFLASMSHELRTPMNAILGFAQFLRGNQEGNLSGQQLSNLEVIGRNAGELLILIEQLLDLSRIEAGRMKVGAEYFEIREVVAESLAVVEPLVGEKAVALWADYEGEHQVFYTDRAKVKQILVNLLSNAIKFTEQGRVGVWVKEEDELVRLTVMDSGVGIAAEHLGTIFEEFRQVRHPGRGQGTGLGLAITRRLCRLLGGDVAVASVPGQGSTFTVSLPVEWRPVAGATIET